MDLIRGLSPQFLVTDHAAGEITDVYLDQLARFEAAVAAGCCEVCRAEDDAALEMFGQLTGTQRLGIGESATIAYAISIGARLALDDKRAANEARRIDGGLVVLGTVVGNADGNPIDPSPESIDALLDVWPIFEAFQLAYVSKGLLLEQEKNASTLSPNGPSAGATATARVARKPARTARCCDRLGYVGRTGTG